MSVQHFVDEQERYDGKTLQELWSSVVDESVGAVDPAERHDDVGSIPYWPAREAARCIGGRVSKQSDSHEWLRFAPEGRIVGSSNR